jgi:hypothetical protein
MAPLFDPIPASTLLGGRHRRAATAGSGPAPPYPSAHLCRKYGGVIEPVNQRRKAAALPQAPEVNGFSSYPPEEVTFLVKDLSGVLVEVSRTEYEDEISQGRHYAEMLPEEEFRPTAEALNLFEQALNDQRDDSRWPSESRPKRCSRAEAPIPSSYRCARPARRSGCCYAAGRPGGTGRRCSTTPSPSCRVTASTTMPCPTYSTATTSQGPVHRRLDRQGLRRP